MLIAMNNTGIASSILLIIQFGLYLGIAICSAKVLVENVCNTEECQKTGIDISKNMNRSVLPCDNFYQFVCGKFAEDVILSDTVKFVSASNKMEDSTLSLIEFYLDKKSSNHTNEHFQEAFQLYELCKNRDAVSGQEANDLAQIVNEIGGWPIVQGAQWKKQRWEIIAGRLSKLGTISDVLFDVQVEAGTSVANSTILLNAKRFNEFTRTSWERLREIAVEMGADNSTEIEKLSNTSTVIAFNLLKDRSTENDHYGSFTIEEMTMRWPSIDWMMYFKGVFSVWSVISINENQRVYANLDYINDVVDAIRRTNESEIMNYVVANLIEGYLSFLQYELSGDSNSALDQQTINPTSEIRKKNCARFTALQLPEMIDAMFLVNHVTDQQRREIIGMFDSLKTKMRALIEQAHWLDISKRQNLVNRLSNLTVEIGYEAALKNNKYFERLKDLHFDGRSFPRSVFSLIRFLAIYLLKKTIDPFSSMETSSPVTDRFDEVRMIEPNARYMSISNKIVILPGILQDPYVNERLPKYIDYGGIGFAIAHELAHAFPSKEEIVDEYEHGMILNKTSSPMLNRINCFRNRSTNYITKEFNLTFDGLLTVVEDMADNIGIKLAHSIYEDWMSHNQPVSTLPHLNYTAMQMFWISYSRIKCVKYNSKHVDDSLKNDGHSLEEYRTNGVLSNHPAFSEAFGCQFGSPMNPVEKCTIW